MERLRRNAKIGLIQFMAFPAVGKGDGPILETLGTILADDYFDAVEVTRTNDPDVARTAARMIEMAHCTVAFGAQPVILAGKLNLNAPDASARRKAIDGVSACFDQAAMLGSVGVAVLSGPCEAGKEAEGQDLLVDSMVELSGKADGYGMQLVLEIFDDAIDKKSLVGKAPVARAVGERGATRSVRPHSRSQAKEAGMGWNVLVTRRIPQPGIDILTGKCETVDVNPDDRVLTQEELIAGVTGRDGVLCLLTDTIDDAVFAAAGPQCKIFANYAVGYNNIDVDAAKARGIRITNTPGVLTDATADMAWALLFAAARRTAESDKFMRSGQWGGWGPMQFLGQDITGRTLGVIGAGRIGTNFALKSAGFRMKVLYTDTTVNADLESQVGAHKVEMDELLQSSDFVSIHVPLMPETVHLIGRRELELMKPNAVLVNTSRGPVVDEKALVEVLKTGRIAAAGLDVYEDEPKAAPGLVDLPNVVACPHTASATIETRTKMATMAADNLVAVLEGREPENPVV